MTLASTSFLGLSGLKLDIKQSPQRLVFTPSVTAEGKTLYISGAHNAKIALGSDSDTVHIDVTVASGRPQRSTLAGTSNSTFRTRQGSDTMLFRVSAADPITGIGVAVQNTFISGNSGDDSIHMEAAAGKTRLWGRQAVVFGGAGNDVVTGVGSAQNCFIQMGRGDDDLSIGAHSHTNPTLRWTQKNGTQAAYGVIRGGDGCDRIHFQHLCLSQFRAIYRPLAGGGFTLGADPTRYLEFETVALNDGNVVPM